MRVQTKKPERIDWKAERERIDLAAVVTRLLGPSPGRRGEGGRKLWWRCPFHDDQNPSLCVEPGKPWFRCYGCGERGDAARFVMKLEGLTFPEAVASLTGGHVQAPRKPPTSPAKPAPPKPAPEPSGLPEADALALVEESQARLWTPEGSEALAYLTGPRGLSHETIRAARLGWVPEVSIPTRNGDRFLHASGITLPWFSGEELALVKIRQPEGRKPKYAEAYRNPARLLCYPSPETVRPGRPLVVTEGEFDALCLGEALGDMAACVSLGSASSRPTPEVFALMLGSPRWYLGMDADEAGDKAAQGWPARARRVRPPDPWKDWTEARAGLPFALNSGLNLRRWWEDIFRGIDNPPRFTWEELQAQRWGSDPDDHPEGVGGANG